MLIPNTVGMFPIAVAIVGLTFDVFFHPVVNAVPILYLMLPIFGGGN